MIPTIYGIIFKLMSVAAQLPILNDYEAPCAVYIVHPKTKITPELEL